MDINYKLIGRRISGIRKEYGMTQERLAEICDVSSRYISAVETGNKRASLKVLAAISQALPVSMDELIFGPTAMTNRTEEWAEIIKGCSVHERDILTDTAIALKKALRVYSHVRQ